jgi:ABC-type sugar transport system ATPase subunit
VIPPVSLPPLVSAVGVTKNFPGVRALDHVDFAVEVGEVHALLGENGAGKSTLTKVLAGDYPADGGWVEVSGQRSGSVIRALRRGSAW